MKKVKLLEVYCEHDYSDDYETKVLEVIKDVTDWEEISDEDYGLLQKSIAYKNRKSRGDGMGNMYVLITESEPSPKLIISEFLEHEKKLAQERDKRAKAKEEADKARKKERARKKREKELAELAKLQEKYGKE